MIKKLWSFAINVCFLALIANWLVRGSMMAHNFSVFLIWLHGVMGLLLWGVISSGKAPSPVKCSPISSRVGGVLNIAAAPLLIGYGQFLLATVYIFYLTGAAVLLSMANDEDKKGAAAAA
jgi:hypothetical protein